MNTRTKFWGLILLTIIIFGTGCYNIESVNQPLTADLNDTITVNMVVSYLDNSMYGDGLMIPSLGILLPNSWTVVDSIYWNSIFDSLGGILTYDATVSDSLNLNHLTPPGYSWWAARGDSTDVYSADTIFISPQIIPGANPGFFGLEYAVGDEQPDEFTDRFPIWYGLPVDTVNADLYVDPDGNDNNSGLSAGEPVQTIWAAVAKIRSDSLNRRTIHVADGNYALTATGESLPIKLKKNLILSGESVANTVLDGENNNRVLDLVGISNTRLENFTVTNGNAPVHPGTPYSEGGPWSIGGGIYCDDSQVDLTSIRIFNNLALFGSGGGIYSVNSELNLENVEIDSNKVTAGPYTGYGGGIYCYHSTLNLSSCTIKRNISLYIGGGIYTRYSTVSFDSLNHNNIFLNQAATPRGWDIYAADSNYYQVVLDTFTISPATEMQAYPTDQFTFDINISKLEPIMADLYVSNSGFIYNDGLTATSPLPTITTALTLIQTDSLNPRTIHLDTSTFSFYSSEIFPLEMKSYLTLAGPVDNWPVIDAYNYQSASNVFDIINKDEVRLNNLILREGDNLLGGAVHCKNSTLSLENINIRSCTADSGGAIFIDSSIVAMAGISLKDNSAYYLGGGIYASNSELTLGSSRILENHTNYYGGGIYFNNSTCEFDSLLRSSIFNNIASMGRELGASSSPLFQVYLDTFTTNLPTDLYSYPEQNFNFDILHYIIIAADSIFISPSGSPANSGLTLDEPLGSITAVIDLINAGTIITDKLMLSNGEYSSSATNESFPIVIPTGLSLVGESPDSTIINAEEQERVIFLQDVNQVKISTLSLTNGSFPGGAGLSSLYSEFELDRVLIHNNSGINGTGITLLASICSINNSTLTNNYAEVGGVIASSHSDITIHNSIIHDTTSVSIYIYPYTTTSNITVSYSNLSDGPATIDTSFGTVVNWLEGNINADPIFCDPLIGKYTLAANSPCLGTGENGADMGALPLGCAELALIDEPVLPGEYSLHQNYPNPFNPITTIKYELPEASDVRITIYDLLGRQVTTLVSETQDAGYKSIQWDATNDFGQTVSAGMYFYRIQVHNPDAIGAGGYVQIKRMILLK